mmetsp:Transcript_14757/g.16904  ORF Transcript_14757/g.16904 Transcript_14757/m.16904 type:complete len:1371 (-) Transcript_14757:129-4241(-)
MATPLKVNDPVYVSRDSQQLEGILSYSGSVQFADGDDWIGVRLTGSSLGLGKNDGSVRGKRYFTCDRNCGVFVRKSHVTRRVLTKLDELRLKRQLASGATTSSSSPTIRSSPSPYTGGRGGNSNASKRTLASKAKDLTGTNVTTASATKKRLNELRERRAALSSQPSPLSTSVESSRNSARVENSKIDLQEEGSKNIAAEALQTHFQEMQLQITGLRSSLTEVSAKLKKKEEEHSSLHNSLSRAEQDAREHKIRLEELEITIKSKEKERIIQVSSEKMHEQLENLQANHSKMETNKSQLQDFTDNIQSDLILVRRDLEREREARATEAQELQVAKANLLSVEQQLHALNNQAASRTTSDASHYKERAKLQAELGAMKRLNKQLENEKLDLEATLEDLTLDKEQLAEEKEDLEDRVEELKIDAETAQMEVEELRLELEDAKESLEGGGNSSMSVDADDAAQALTTQNARLREALIRLREQSSFETMELSRQLRTAEKEQTENAELKKEMDALRFTKTSLEEQIEFLKETVDQCSAFESMVEDLSDRVMMLEDDNISLQSTLREMEDAADIAAELEEVQADEVKALMLDLEGRDTIVRNLEDAIKMQRRREEDFQRTVINYRNSVETLKQEKNELLALQRGGEGEKSEIIASSQKALARAAQLVSDAAKARKQEAEHAFKWVERDIQRHLSNRLEAMLPHSIVSVELSAIKGEMLLCKVVGKASLALDALSASFSKAIRSGMNEVIPADESKSELSGVVRLSDEVSQTVDRLMHETRFSMSTVEMSSELLRLLAAGQWPDVLSKEESADLGSAFLHSLSDLDASIGSTLKILKEEGVLSPHRSNLAAFRQSIQTTLQDLKSFRNIEDKPLLADDWRPPCWKVFKDISLAKFSCMGSGAAIAAALRTDGTSESSSLLSSALKNLMTKMEQVTGEAIKIGSRMGRLEVTNEKVVKELENAALSWKHAAQGLIESVTCLFSKKGEIGLEKIKTCEGATDAVLKAMSQFISSLRAADLDPCEELIAHPLSAESKDPWSAISMLTQAIRSIDGDKDDVNFLIRARSIEHRLTSAIENIPTLIAANSKISTLEKTLGSRSKEIAIQNARLSELEKILAKQTSPVSRNRVQSSASVTEELMSLKEENRVLTDAMDVLQQQVDEYESEIRAMNNPKSPKGRLATPRKSSRNLPRTPLRSSGGINEDAAFAAGVSPASSVALQATLFRPAFESMQNETSIWKSNMIAQKIMELPPLSNCGIRSPELKKDISENNILTSLEAARSTLRLEQASFRLVNLTAKTPPRVQLLGSLSRVSVSEQKLREVTATASSALAKQGITKAKLEKGSLLGRIQFSDNDTYSPVPISVTMEDIRRIHLHIIQ